MASGLRRRPRGSRILVYHLVLREDRARFEEHLRLLRDHYRICPLGDLLRGNGDSRSAEHRLALTFDDGFRVLMEDCLELLEKHALKATFFIPTGFVELSGLRLESDLFSLRRHCWDAPLEPMSVADLQRLVSLGHDVGSHGVSHGSLRDMALESAGLELSASRDRIAAWTGVEPAGFAYPYGETSSSLGRPADWVRAAGYRCALTLRRGVLRESTNPYLLPRDHAEGSWPVGMLRYLLFA